MDERSQSPSEKGQARLPVVLRPCTRADLPVLYEIDRSCYAPEVAYSRGTLKAFLEQEGVRCLMAFVEGRPAGFVMAFWQGEEGHLITLDVLARYRRKGIGSTLLLAIEEQMRRAGVSWVELETSVANATAIAFWTHHGYRITGTLPGYYSDRTDAYLMAKRLDRGTGNRRKAG
jgi:ribosomal protein S18 acetylase RimI-like enzyme